MLDKQSPDIIQITHEKGLFADVLLPIPIPKLFTYRISDNYFNQVEKGFRVIVQFGKKTVTGIIWQLHHVPPKVYDAKFILDVIDEMPILSDIQLPLFEWIAKYYMCTMGEVMNAGLPTGLKLSSESKIQLHPEFSLDESSISLNDKELMLIKSLEFGKSMTYPEAAKLLEVKNIYHILKSLINKNALLIYEEIKEKYKPKKDFRQASN